MKKILLLTLFSLFITAKSFSQFTTDEITYIDRLDIDETNSWAVGAAFTNFIMHGDLRSIATHDDKNYWNFGGMIYVDKMFNPILGLELKATYSKMSGGVQSFSDVYDLLYVDNNVIREDMKFEGTAYGAELNLIMSFSNLFRRVDRNWNISGYFGVGYHQYDSALFEQTTDGSYIKIDEADFGYNPRRNSVNQASSIYLSTQLGIKRKISKRVDLEFRTGMYFNNEDHLDAAISNKQTWESFFVTSLGVVVKLGKKKMYTLWADETVKGDPFKVIDTDKDGVMDKLDVEPNTPIGAMVYGNGRAIDSEKDGLQDYKDKCPLRPGPISNEGCPLDTDGDGVLDDRDLCPETPGLAEYNGCPKSNNIDRIGLLATAIYFDTDSDKIRDVSFSTIDEIVTLMKEIPTVKFSIEGNTDSRNSDEYNLDLSKRRAASVVEYMVSKGIPSERLTSEGFGESRPKFSNDNAGGRQLNRRVKIKPIPESID